MTAEIQDERVLERNVEDGVGGSALDVHDAADDALLDGSCRKRARRRIQG